MIAYLKNKLKQNSTLVRWYQKMIGYDPKAKQWCRIVMDRETNKLIKGLQYHDFSALEISGAKWKEFGFKRYTNVNYPEFDICFDQPNEKFDLVIAEQVFEHLLWPYKAGKNIFSMLSDNGYFLITTPFLLKVHPQPHDCMRWTETGMKYFLAECGFETSKILSASWGNKQCIVENFDEWMPYNPKKHPLGNEEEFPVVVWALAQK